MYQQDTVQINALTSNETSIWAGTQSEGILEIRNGKVTRQLLVDEPMEDKTAKAIYANNDYLWVATFSDFLRVNIKSGKAEK